MSDDERRRSRYSRFVPERPRKVTFEKSNRRPERRHQQRRQTVQSRTRQSERTHEGRGRGRTHWRARGVPQIDNGQSWRSQQWNRRRGEREHHQQQQHAYRDERNRRQARSEFQQRSYGTGPSGHRPEQLQRSRQRQQGWNPGLHRTSRSGGGQDVRRTVPQSRFVDSRDRSMETVSVRRSRTPSPPSQRTISITVSTSQSKSERPQEVSQGEVEVPVSTVVSLVSPEVVNGQEEAVPNQQPQQTKGIRRRNTRQQVCPLCKKVVDMVKRHMAKRHLPWYFAPELACWACEKAQETGAQLWANHAICPGDFNDHRLGMWAATIWGWLHLLAEMLGLAGVNELLEKVVREKLHLCSFGSNVSPTRKTLMLWLQKVKGSPVEDITLAPPNCVSALLDWQTIQKLLLQLPEEAREKLADFPLTGSTEEVIVTSNVPVADGHCHLEGVVQRLGGNKLEDIWQVAVGAPQYLQLRLVVWNRVFPEAWRWPLDNITTPVQVINTVGVHPRLATQEVPWEELEVKIRTSECVGVGECGLDETAGDMTAQETVFVRQLRLAHMTGKVLVLHIRSQGASTEIHRRVLRLVSSHLSRQHKVYIHCYSADWDIYMAWTKTFPNLMIGVTTLTTKLPDFLKLGRLIPLTQLAVETDSPYLPPFPYGVNLPQLVHHQAQTLAEVRNLPLSMILEETYRNVRRFFLRM